MNEAKQYYIVSIKHTSKGDTALTFWCHASRGYTWDRMRAGLYDGLELPAIVNDENIAVEKDKVDQQWRDANDFGDRYVAVPNSPTVLKELGLSTKLMKPKKFATCRMIFKLQVSQPCSPNKTK